jgi:hypothetical protein
MGLGELHSDRHVLAVGEWWSWHGEEGDRSGPVFGWWLGSWDSGGRCFACSWAAMSLLRVVHVRHGWARDLLACRRHGSPPRWRRRVWDRARPPLDA